MQGKQSSKLRTLRSATGAVAGCKTHEHMYIHTYLRAYVGIYVCMYVYICVFVCVYVCACVWWTSTNIFQARSVCILCGKLRRFEKLEGAYRRKGEKKRG